MQAVVADIVDRFVNSPADAYAFTLRVATVGNPNWRAKALPMMTPIPVQSPGVQGWLLAKENARLLLSELSRRTDYREYNSSQQLVNNGQSIVISTMRPRQYVKGAIATQTAWPGYQPEMGTIEEGFSLEFSPLLALDLASADAVVKLRLNQVEKMLPVKLDLPTTVAPNQRVRSRRAADDDVEPARALPLADGQGAAALDGRRRHARPRPRTTRITDAMTDAVPMLKIAAAGRRAAVRRKRRQSSRPRAEPPTARAATLPQQSFQGRY